MKNYFYLIALFILFSFSVNAQLENPSSVVYDSVNDQYFVANAGTTGIYSIDLNGQLTLFKDGFVGLLSLEINNGILYVSEGWVENKNIYGYDINTGAEEFFITIDEAISVNDLVFDESGNLYVSDRAASQIYKVNVQNGTYEIFLVPSQITDPNGLLFRSPDKLIVLESTTSTSNILEVDINTGTVTLLTASGFISQDGITADNAGNIYITSWGEDSFTCNLFYYPSGDFTQVPVVLLSNSNGMGDIDFGASKNELAIPNWFNNDVTYYDLSDISDSREIITGHQFLLYPNPVAATESLNIKLNNKNAGENWDYEIIAANGQLLTQGIMNGISEINIDLLSKNLNAGMYYFIVRKNGFIFYKKFIVY